MFGVVPDHGLHRRPTDVIRIIVGLVLIGLALAGTIGPWGWIGVVPLATALFRFCPLYTVLGSVGVKHAFAVDPEKVDAYEVGVKADLLDRRLSLNTAGFINDFRDFQAQVFDPALNGGLGSFRTGNASTLNEISWPTATPEASVSRTKAVSHTVERSPITNTGSLAPAVTYWPGPILR